MKDRGTPAASMRRLAAAVVVGGAVLGACRAPRGDGPAPRWAAAHDRRPATNASCVRCHAAIGQEWRASLHRASHTDPAYQRQFALEPRDFCTRCHAPESMPGQPVTQVQSEQGVSCLSCHVPHEARRTIGAHPDKAGDAGLDPTPSCARCHEFSFPSDGFEGPDGPLPMQSTVSEHAGSPYADVACAECHMPWVSDGPDGRHRSHRFLASRSPSFVRSAIEIERHFDGRRLRLVLRPGRVGHAFPTGDVLRRLKLTIVVRGADGSVRDRVERVFSRRVVYAGRGNRPPQRVVAGDDRLGPEPKPRIVTYRPASMQTDESLTWRLRYERVGGPADSSGRVPVDGAVNLGGETLTGPTPSRIVTGAATPPTSPAASRP